MIIRKDLTSLVDQSVWISDDRISALASARCGGIEQIDFHGKQPVSRNAKLLHHPKGVLKFELEWQVKDKIQKVVLDWRNLTIFPFGIEQIHQQEKFTVKLLNVVKKDQLSVTCICTPNHTKIKPNLLKFRVLWNQKSQTKEVHGNQLWTELDSPDSGTVLLMATDQIYLWKWLQREGDYQGDFLIPENWRRMIFKRNCISGTAKIEDLKEEFNQTELKLYDADTFVVIGNSNYSKFNGNHSWLTFEIEAAKLDKGHWIFPDFTVQFYTQGPESVKHKMLKNNWSNQSKRYKKLLATLPQLKLPGFPKIEEFFLQAPQIIEFAKVQDLGMTRACPGTYYWIWSWDNIVTAQVMARFGDITFLRNTVNFLRLHRDIDGAIPGRWSRHLEAMDSRGIGGLDFLFCELVVNLYSETSDQSILQVNYPVLHQVFREISQKCHNNGFFPTMGMYPDLPKKMGRSGQDFVAIDAGMWYCFCRNLEKIALIQGDAGTAVQAGKIADHIKSHFFELFWSEEKGFILDSVNPETGKRNLSFPLFSFLFTEFPFGQVLLKDKIDQCGNFIERHLLTDCGVRITPTWDIHHSSEPIMSAWYPHWDLPATTVLSRAQKNKTLSRWLINVTECYQALGYCPEFVTLGLRDEKKWQHHGAAWNLNCAAGWYHSIIQNITGIVFDLGGITLYPANVVEKLHIKKLWFRGGQWDVRLKGVGNYIQNLIVDNQTIHGTWKIPAPFYTNEKHTVKIHLGNDLPESPVLTEFWGGSVDKIEKNKKSSRYQIYGLGRTDLTFLSEKKPKLLLDNLEMDFIWHESKHLGFCQLILSGNHKLEIEI